MINSYYSQDVHGPYELYDVGNLELEDGGTIRSCSLAYATFGRLNATKDNAILIPTWYSGTNKLIEQVYLGEGRALDPSRYFIVIINQIGGGLSTSPHNTPAPAGMANFPHVRIGDDVRAQHKLVTEKFGLTNLALVVGGSMGAQQTYEWAVRYPDMVKRAAPIAGTSKNTVHDFLFTETLVEAITSDPGFNKGFYELPIPTRSRKLIGTSARCWLRGSDWFHPAIMCRGRRPERVPGTCGRSAWDGRPAKFAHALDVRPVRCLGCCHSPS